MAATHLSDAQLVHPCRAGEAKAWRDLVDPFPRYAYALAAERREQPADDLLPAETEAVLADLDEAFAVHEALSRLPEPCREVLDRFFTRDESYRTIGDELQLPAGTIASRISRCLRKLREQLEGRSSTA